MKSEPEIRDALRRWLAKANGKMKPEQITDELNIVEERVIPSLKLMELLIYIEHLSGRTIDPGDLSVGMFSNLNSIYTNFFQ